VGILSFVFVFVKSFGVNRPVRDVRRSVRKKTEVAKRNLSKLRGIDPPRSFGVSVVEFLDKVWRVFEITFWEPFVLRVWVSIPLD